MLPTCMRQIGLPGWQCIILLGSAVALLFPSLVKIQTMVPGNAGHPDLPGTLQYFWAVHTDGLWGVAHSQLLAHPNTLNRIVLDGFPLDALLAWPFLSVLGWPAGFTVFQVLVLWALGLSTAWCAMIWWSTDKGALIAGLVGQSGAFILREISEGRPTQVLASVFIALTLCFFLRGLHHQPKKNGLIAGLCLGLSTLTYWYAGLFGGLLVLGLGVLSLRQNLHTSSATRWASLALFVCTFLPILYVLVHLDQQPAMDVTHSSTILHAGVELELTELLYGRSILSGASQEGAIIWDPLLFGLCLIPIWTTTRRHWLFPLGIIGFGFLMAMGPQLPIGEQFKFPLPFRFLSHVPGLRRLWWPDRFLMMAAPMVAILCAGGMAWIERAAGRSRATVTIGLFLVFLGLRFLLCPNLPMKTADVGPSEAALALMGPDTPVLVLPSAAGHVRRDSWLLVDQIHHQRPLVNGAMDPFTDSAPKGVTQLLQNPALAHLFNCERFDAKAWTANTAEGIAHLREIGLTSVHLDMLAFDPEAPSTLRKTQTNQGAFLTCVQTLLGQEYVESGPFHIFELNGASKTPNQEGPN